MVKVCSVVQVEAFEECICALVGVLLHTMMWFFGKAPAGKQLFPTVSLQAEPAYIRCWENSVSVFVEHCSDTTDS